MTTTILETRSEFGFPQLASFFTKEPEQKPKQTQNNYRIQNGDGEEEDYYDQLGAVI